MTGSRRRLSFLLLVCLVLAWMTPLVSSGGAQTSVPAGEYTSAFPDGPPIDIPVIDSPTEESGPDPQEPNPNEPNPNEPNPGESSPNKPNPNEPDPPAPDIPDGPPLTVVPIEITPLDIPDPADGIVSVEVLAATINIRTRVCDNEGFDPYFNYVLEEMEAECPLLTEASGFSMYSPTLALSKVTSGGVVAFTVPARSTVTLESVRPDGYDMSIYTCASAVQARQWRTQEPTVMPLAWETTIGEAIECTWFFVQNNDDVNLMLTKLACPWFDASTLSRDSVFCDGTLGIWGDVTLSDTDPATADIVRSASGDVHLSFTDLPPDTYTVTETNVTPGTAWTYMGHCYNADAADGAPKPTFPLVRSTTFTVTLDQVGDTVACTSTNVEAAASGNHTSEFAQSGPQPMAWVQSGFRW